MSSVSVIKCGICSKDFFGSGTEDTFYVGKKCGHGWHRSCIEPVIKESKECFNCRTSLPNQTSIVKLNLHFRKVSTAYEKGKQIELELRELREKYKALEDKNEKLKMHLGEAVFESKTTKNSSKEKENTGRRLKAEPKVQSTEQRNPNKGNFKPSNSTKAGPSKTMAKQSKQSQLKVNSGVGCLLIDF